MDGLNDMDFSFVYTAFANVAWFLVPLITLTILIRSSWFKGVFGEWQVNLLISCFLDKKSYHLIKNVTLPTTDGSTQIDHIVVSQFGIFVIETKNMKGWIFGREHQKQWTQKIFRNSFKFQNPLHQNYKHTQTLADCLDVDSSAIHSVIIFIGESEFKTEMPANVTFARQGIRHIKSFIEPVFNGDEVIDIIDEIEKGRLTPSFRTNRQHVAHVKNIIEAKYNERNCARCGQEMVLRITKKGQNAGNEFWGCSAFPKCRYVVN